MSAAESPVVNQALITLRDDKGLSQQDLADELNDLAARTHDKHPMITRKTIGRWERGQVVWPQPFYRRLLGEYFGVSVEELGFRRPRTATRQQTDDLTSTTPAMALITTAPADPYVLHDQERWRDSRAALGRHRRGLAVLAEGLYRDYRIDGLRGSGAITVPAWLPDQPVLIDEITLELNSVVAEPIVAGGEPDSASVRPLATIDRRFRRYHDAVRDLAAPTLFENRLCFRIIEADWRRPMIRFGQMGFYDAIDINEALAHEFASNHLAIDRETETTLLRPSWRRLAFRKLIGNPFDLSRRPLMGAIGTLTIRGGESPSLVLHQRDGERVAGGGGMIHLLPAGIFQPSSVLPAAIAEDFSIWRNIQREYAEELLGHGEYDGSGQPIRYDSVEPFTTMDRARAAGKIRVYCLGVTLDALTLAGDIITAAVIEPDVYDELFAEIVKTNSEGSVAARALPFEENTLKWLRESQQLSPGAAAALHFAWRHRHSLLR